MLSRNCTICNGKGTLVNGKTLCYITAGLALLLLPMAAHAQHGCIHSPECPTALLGVVGAGGAALYARWRSR